MKPPIQCSCGYEDVDAAAFTDHMLLTRHGLPRKRYALCIETGYLWTLENAFRMSQDETEKRESR